jgi:hypothetical protein
VGSQNPNPLKFGDKRGLQRHRGLCEHDVDFAGVERVVGGDNPSIFDYPGPKPGIWRTDTGPMDPHQGFKKPRIGEVGAFLRLPANAQCSVERCANFSFIARFHPPQHRSDVATRQSRASGGNDRPLKRVAMRECHHWRNSQNERESDDEAMSECLHLFCSPSGAPAPPRRGREVRAHRLPQIQRAEPRFSARYAPMAT